MQTELYTYIFSLIQQYYGMAYGKYSIIIVNNTRKTLKPQKNKWKQAKNTKSAEQHKHIRLNIYWGNLKTVYRKQIINL